MSTIHTKYMKRCIQLARLGSGNVAPNPMVGAVLVYNECIIGEGYHQKYGEAHAEVNCIRSVPKEQEHLIPQSILYVSLEPCAHFGKTPPCVDLIIQYKIPIVVIGCCDPFKEVSGKGIDKLKAAGVKVHVGILENECQELNKRFFTFHTQHRPYIILKWAQTLDGKMGPHPNLSPTGEGMVSTQTLLKQDINDNKETQASGRSGADILLLGQSKGVFRRLFITNVYTNRIVHKWRSEEMAIAVGTNTALLDNPQLNARLWSGKNPIRIVTDMNMRLPISLNIFDGTIPTIVFNFKKHTINNEWLALLAKNGAGVGFYKITEDAGLVPQILKALHSLHIQSVLIEGGSRFLQSFIDEGMWDEARVITNNQLIIGDGLPAPALAAGPPIHTETIVTDTIRIYKNSPHLTK